MGIREFRFQLDAAAVADLRARLAATRWPRGVPAVAGEPAATDWSLGADLGYMQRLLTHWGHGFDWQAWARDLNRFPQFIANAQGQDIHFVRERGSGPHAIPLILTHGWPGSFHEYLGIVDLLAHPERHGAPDAVAFDVIVPSLPGFGFSGRPARPMGPRAVAALWHGLMTGVLGYSRFAAQGGDWGSLVSAWLGADHGESLMGLHLHAMGVGPFRGSGTAPLDAQEAAWVGSARGVLACEGAYQHLQATKPLTLAYGLTDSPAALAAWIVEKFHGWSASPGGLPSGQGMDTLLANISLYWMTQSAETSTWIYHAARKKRELVFAAGQQVAVPTAFALFPGDLFPPCPRQWLERSYDVARYTVMPDGGHFAALEKGPALVADIRAFFAAQHGEAKRDVSESALDKPGCFF